MMAGPPLTHVKDGAAISVEMRPQVECIKWPLPLLLKG